METSLTNYHIRHSDAGLVERAVKNVISDSAYLSSPQNGWVSLNDATSEPQEVHRIASTLSAGLGALVIAFLTHEDEALTYALYDRGNLRDEFCSKPEHAGPVPAQRLARLRGRPEIVWEYCPDATVGEVQEAFEAEEPEAPADDMVSRVRAQFQQQLAGSQPEDIRKMLQMAVDQARFMPPPMVKMMLQSMGIPADHPSVAPLMENPAAFLQSMLLNPDAIKRITEQFAAAPASAAKGPSARALMKRLARLLNIDPARTTESFAKIRSGDQSAFQLVQA